MTNTIIPRGPQFSRTRGPAAAANVKPTPPPAGINVTHAVERPTDRHRWVDATTGSAGNLQELIAVLSSEFINIPPDATDDAITSALRRIGELAQVDRAYVFVIDGETMANTNEWCGPGIKPRMAELQRIPTAAYPHFMSRILSGQCVLIPRVADLHDDHPDKALLMAEQIRSLLAVPILARSQVIGFVGFDLLHTEKQWTHETTTFLEIVGTIFGNALDRRSGDRALMKEKDFLTNVFETAAGLMIVLAPDGRCLRVNRAFSELTGLAIEELQGIGWRRVIPDESREEARQALRSALAGKPVQFEVPLVTHDHETRPILWRGSVIRSADGQPEYVIVSGVDLTETLHLREQLEQSRRLDSLGRVAATIAHEFNNVLMAIQPSADLIRRYPDHQNDVERAAERIERAVKRGVKITTEVTRFARRSDPMRQSMEVRPWIEGLVDEMRSVLRERNGEGVVLETTPIDPNTRVVADIDQIHQVFSNLILNAADAIPVGGTITVSVEEITQHELLPESDPGTSRWTHWQVSDTGIGIPPSVLERIFEPLFTTKKQGTGLGLAVAHQIIKAHDGHLSVETTVGRGTTFHVFLHCDVRPGDFDVGEDLL